MMRWLFILSFILGLGLGIGGTYFAPDLLGPYLPEMFQRRGELVQGEVVAKQEKMPWLLLTINTPQGAILATFKKKVDEIALLVEVGDQIELILRSYEPFVEDPRIKRVRKGDGRIEIPPAAPAEEEALVAPQATPQSASQPDIEVVEAPEKKAISTSPLLPAGQKKQVEPVAESGTKAASEVEEKADVEETPSPFMPAGPVEEKGVDEKKVGGKKSPTTEPAVPIEGETAL